MIFNYCPKCGQKDAIQQQGPTNYTCQACDWRFWNNPKTSVTTLFVRDNQVLTAVRGSTYSRQDLNGKMELIGGFVDYNESVYDAARREAEEELGVKIKNLELIDIWNREYDTTNMPPISVCDAVFVITDWEGTPTPGDDVASLQWRPIEAIDDPAQAFSYPGLVKKLRQYLSQSQQQP
jgi:8-oxo-dGTP pyrophosphatase MutT (NUDIX family)